MIYYFQCRVTSIIFVEVLKHCAARIDKFAFELSLTKFGAISSNCIETARKGQWIQEAEDYWRVIT